MFSNEVQKMAISIPSFPAADKINVLISTFWVGLEVKWLHLAKLISFADIFINLSDKETISQYKFLKARDFISHSPNSISLSMMQAGSF